MGFQIDPNVDVSYPWYTKALELNPIALREVATIRQSSKLRFGMGKTRRQVYVRALRREFSELATSQASCGQLVRACRTWMVVWFGALENPCYSGVRRNVAMATLRGQYEHS